MSEIVHAGLIAVWAGRWRGVLIEGPSGAGKSGLALRAAPTGFRLVADDRVLLWTSGGRLYGRAPETLQGLIEVRGLGILRESPLAQARIDLIVACAASPEAVERLPDPVMGERLGMEIPLLALWPFDLAAAAKLRRAIGHLGGGD